MTAVCHIPIRIPIPDRAGYHQTNDRLEFLTDRAAMVKNQVN